MRTIASFLFVAVFCSCNSDPDIRIDNDPDLKVYPNPFIETVTVYFSNPSGTEFSIAVFGPNGEEIFHENDDVSDGSYSINVSDKPEGAYQVIVRTEEKTITRRVFKVRQ